MVSIDKLYSEDLKGLKLLYEDAFEGSVTDLDQLTRTFAEIKDSPDYIVLCAKREGEIVGSVLGIVCKELFGQCRPFMVLEDVAVLNSCRRQGIGRLLLTGIEEYAQKNQCTMILFVSSEHRTGAHKLYESLGYAADKVNGYRKRLSNQ